MAVQTLVAFANSPAINTNVWGPYVLAFRVIGTVTTWSVKVEAWTGANGTGSRQTCGTLKALQHNWTSGATINSFTGSSVNTVTATSTAALTSGDVVGGQGLWDVSGSPGSLVITMTYDNSFGILVPLVSRGGVWVIDVTGGRRVRRSGAWSGSGRRVRRGSVWAGFICPPALSTWLQTLPQKLPHWPSWARVSLGDCWQLLRRSVQPPAPATIPTL